MTLYQKPITSNAKNRFFNPTRKNAELYVRDCLKGQKILIVMLYDDSLNPGEADFINKKYIFENKDPGRKKCIKKAVEHFGIELKVVQNYKDAILELTKQTRPGYCDYYATWVMCSGPWAILPDKDADADLVISPVLEERRIDRLLGW